MSERATGHKTERMTFAMCGCGCGGGHWLSAKRAIAKVPGVVHVYVNPGTEMAYVEYDEQQLDLNQLTAAVEHTGLQVAELRRL